MTSDLQSLFDRTLVPDYDDEDAWDAVAFLRSNGNREIFETAADWLKSNASIKRARGADILAQLREPGDPVETPRWLFREESFPLLVQLLERETDRMVLDSGISALGHLYNEAGIPIIARYANHPDHDVRFSVACALGHFPNHPLAVANLLPLTRDEQAHIRDWAVFGLGVQGEADSEEIRKALLERLTDTDEDTREEAAAGLGKRQDLRLLPTLRIMLMSSELKVRVAEAAAAMLGLEADPEGWESGDYLRGLDEKFGCETTKALP